MEREHREASGNLRIPDVPEGQNGTAKTEAVIRDMVENNFIYLGKDWNTQFKEVLRLQGTLKRLTSRQRGLFIRSKHYITNYSNCT